MKTTTANKLPLSSLAGVMLLVGCATPQADHILITDQLETVDVFEVSDTYALPRSKLIIAKDPAKPEVLKFTLIQAEDPKHVLGITPDSGDDVETRIAITKATNSNLVSQIDVAVEDRRIEFIQETASLIGTIFQVAGMSTKNLDDPSPPDHAEPGVYDLVKLIGEDGGRGKQGIDITRGMRMDVGPIPPNARKVDGFPFDEFDDVVYHSACREAVLHVVSGGKPDVMRFALADSRYLTAMALPVKGTIKAQPQCGLTVTPEAADTDSDAKVLEELLKQIAELKEKLGDDK